MKRSVVGIRRPGGPEPPPGKNTPTVWFPSMATIAAVLSEDNQALLCPIGDLRPKSLTELSELTGRQVPNLSRSLRMMEGYGLVTLKKNVREIEPIALATEFLIVLNRPEGLNQLQKKPE
jgi:predicted transcriptional regulator